MRPPSAIEAALAAVARIPAMPAHQRTLLGVMLDYCVSHADPAKRFRVTIEFLMGKTGRSKSSVDRDLAALRSAGWIERIQPKRGARRHGFKPGLTWLTPAALTALELSVQRDSPMEHKTKPSSKWKRRERVYRIREDLKPLLSRMRPAQVVWLMSEASSRRRTLQQVLAGGGMDAVLAAGNPVGLVLQLLDGERRPGRSWARTTTAPAQGPGRGGEGITGGAYVRAEQEHHTVAIFGAAARARRDAWRANRSSA